MTSPNPSFNVPLNDEKRPGKAAAFDVKALADAIASAPVTALPSAGDLAKSIRENVSRVWNNEAVAKPVVELVEAEPKVTVPVALDATVRDEVAIVHWIHTPEPDRRCGHATERYKNWEATLPNFVTVVSVTSPPNTNALAFFRALGFRPVKVKAEKGVTGHEDFDEFDLVKYLNR